MLAVFSHSDSSCRLHHRCVSQVGGEGSRGASAAAHVRLRSESDEIETWRIERTRLSLLGGRAVVRAQVCRTHVRGAWARITLDLPAGAARWHSCAPGVNELEAGP